MYRRCSFLADPVGRVTSVIIISTFLKKNAEGARIEMKVPRVCGVGKCPPEGRGTPSTLLHHTPSGGRWGHPLWEGEIFFAAQNH